MTIEKKTTVYFPGLDPFRFFAAFLVVIYHIEEAKLLDFGLSNSFPNTFIKFIGPVAVTFFFVLSGFLITYLLLGEKEKYSTVSIKQFYLRRVLRIWPLYYLIVIVGIFILPYLSIFNESYESFQTYSPAILLMYFTFFSNLGLVIAGKAILFIGHTWSIGVEEQFYLFWPLLIKFIKKPLRAILGVIIIEYAFKFLFAFLQSKYPHSFFEYAVEFLKVTRFECMAIGGIGAYLVYFHKEKLSGWFFSFPIRAAIFTLTFVLLYNGITIQGIHNLLYSSLFCYLILYISVLNKIKLPSFFSYLGTISYGIYMYHPFIIPAVFIFLKKYLPTFENNLVLNLCAYSLVIVLTLSISALSYRFFELPFINLKKRFARN